MVDCYVSVYCEIIGGSILFCLRILFIRRCVYWYSECVIGWFFY